MMPIARQISLAVLALAVTLGPVAAHDRDPDAPSRATERLDRDTARIQERVQERDVRFAEERARIEARAAEDPAKAAEDLAKLEADRTKESLKDSEDLAKAQEDFREESAKEAEDAAEDLARMESRSDDGNHGSSREIADLGQSEGAEHDREGFAVKQGELVALDLSPAAVDAAGAAGFRVIGRERLETLQRDVIHLSVPEGMTAVDGLGRLRQLAPGATIDLVHYYGLGLTAGDVKKPVKRGSLAQRSRSPLTVGLIDTAVVAHPSLAVTRMIPWPAGALAAAPTDHGTAVASLIASEGQPTIFSANIFRGPAERPFTSADVIAQALEWMLRQGVPTINMSLAGPRNALLDRLVRDALARGVVVVAAAGNGGPTAPPAYPAAVPGVIAVTAVDRNHRIYRYANRGPYIAVAAPGVDVLAANSKGGFARFTGTSFATPHVAGWIARCRTAGTSAADCKAQLRRSARDLGTAGYDEIYGYGVID